MADSISAIPQQPFLGRLAEFLRFLEKDRPEFLPPQLGVMQGISKLALPQASTIENLSYGNQPFTMPPSGTGAMIPQAKTGRKPEIADLVSMISGVPGGRAVADVGTKLGNEAADALVRAITGNPQATAPQVIRETSMPFMQAVAPRTPGLLETPVKSDLGFYSALEQATIPLQNKGTGSQFLAQIEKTAGVKPEEIQWTGLDEFLKGKKSVTKQEIQDYLNANRVDVREVRLGEPEAYDATRLYQLEREFNSLKQHPIDDPSFGEEKYDELIRLMNIRDRSTTKNLYNLQESARRAGQRAQSRGMPKAAERYFREAELYGVRAEKLDLESQGMLAPSKFEQYVLPGGENYREILLTLPDTKGARLDARRAQIEAKGLNATDAEKQEWAFIMNQLQPETRDVEGLSPFRNRPEFRSPHYDQPNILAHMRVNDRVVDGKKTLFIEEIQSDWHQAGRKKGYGPQTETTHEAYYTTPNGQRVSLGFGKTQEEAAAAVDPGWQGIVDVKFDTQTKKVGEGVPNAPFKTTWHELTLKRAIQEASEKGYDQIAFTTGKTQAERYDLSKQIKTIVYGEPDEAGLRTVRAITPNGDQLLGGKYSMSEIEDNIGKEMAEKIQKSTGEFDQRTGTYAMSGLDLQVGGEGMKGFYDQILPKSLEKLGKKFDAKVGKTEMGGVEVWAMDITPKMRESVLAKGQPLFAATPAVGLLGRDEEQ